MTSSSHPISTSTSACAWPHADRAVFLCICEDRARDMTEMSDISDRVPSPTLQNLIGKPGVYRRLMERFQDADKRYNSGLFDFRKDTVRKTGTVPDCGRARAAGDCPEFSYPPKSPYEFSVIGIEILGEVYEQFLGKVIRLMARHQILGVPA